MAESGPATSFYVAPGGLKDKNILFFYFEGFKYNFNSVYFV